MLVGFGPDDRGAEYPRRGGRKVDPTSASGEARRATAEAESLGGLDFEMLFDERSEFDCCELGETLVVQLSSASVAASSTGGASSAGAAAGAFADATGAASSAGASSAAAFLRREP